MALRKRPVADRYIDSSIDEPESVEKFSSGSLMIDLVVGGGYPVGRVVNVVGDFSSGKSLSVIETCMAFSQKYPDGIIRYVETESAFDMRYASSIGLPLDRVHVESDLNIIEDIFKDFDAFISDNKDVHKLYIIDSLDAVSDADEIERDVDKGTMGMGKAKQLGQFFRRLNSKGSKSHCTLIIVSQIRENINASRFGEKYRRSGGKALDFYSSIVLWLQRIDKLEEKVGVVERIIGIVTKLTVKKNKVGPPFRTGLLNINFEYGTDDEISCLEWIKSELKKDVITLGGKEFKINAIKAAIKKARKEENYGFLARVRKDIFEETQQLWNHINEGFRPKINKKALLEAEADASIDIASISDSDEEKKPRGRKSTTDMEE